MSRKLEIFQKSRKIEEREDEKVERELEILKEEIKAALDQSNCIRYFIEFEKGFIPFLPRKKQFFENKHKKINLKELLRMSEEYLSEIENLPLEFILKGTQNVVTTDSWIAAFLENNHLKMLKKLQRMRKNKIFDHLNDLEFKPIRRKSRSDFLEGKIENILFKGRLPKRNELLENDGNTDVTRENLLIKSLDEKKNIPNVFIEDMPVKHGCKEYEDNRIEHVKSTIEEKEQTLIQTLEDSKEFSKSTTISNKIVHHNVTKKEILKRLAIEAKTFVKTNTVYHDEEITIMNFSYTHVHPKEEPLKISQPLKSEISSIMKSRKSKTNFKTPNLKKKGVCHASHAMAASKVPFELGRLMTPSEIVHFKMVRNQNNNNFRQ